MNNISDAFDKKLATLDGAARHALNTVAAYYLQQVRLELHDGTLEEVATALSETRQALDCRVLAAELPAESQEQLLTAYPHLTPQENVVAGDPDDRAVQVDAILRDTALDLFELLARADRDRESEPADPLPRYEQFHAGDRVVVRAPRRPGYELNGCTGTFHCYTDPRIGHETRFAEVKLDGNFHGKPEDGVYCIRPAHLDFALEDEALQRFRELADFRTEPESWEEQHAAGRHNPALVLMYSLNQDSKDKQQHRVTLLAGRDDDLTVYTDGWSVYVLAVNTRLGYAGLERFVGNERSDDHFFQEGQVEHQLGDDFFELGSLEMLERILWATSDYMPPGYEQGPPLVFGRFEQLGTWQRDGFRLELYDTFRVDRLGKSILAYRFFDEHFDEDFESGRTAVFRGADFCCSPLHAVDSDVTVASLLSHLSLRPGDTDEEHFESYTPEQLEWCQLRGEELSLLAEFYRQRHEWKELHDQGCTDEVVLAIARDGCANDLFEVLDLDVFESYDVIEDVASRHPDDGDLLRLSCQLLNIRNAESGANELLDSYP